MPIKGFTEHVRETFPEIGRLRKGGERQGNAPGKDLEWFRFTSERPEIEQAFASTYGSNPEDLASFEVYLPYTTVDDNFQTGRAKYLAGGLDFICDGENMTLWRDGNGTMRHDPQPCPYCSGERPRTDTDPGCVQFGRLTVILPRLLEQGYVGHVVMETHAWNDIRSILGSLRKTASERTGNPMGLRGIRFNVYRVLNKVSTPWSKDNRRKRARRDKWLVKIEPAAVWVRAQLEAQSQAAMLPEPTVALLLERNATAMAEREAAEIHTPYGYVNAAHVARDPMAVDGAQRERDSAPIAGHTHGKNKLFKDEAPQAGPEEPIEGEFHDPEPEPAPEPANGKAQTWTKLAGERKAFKAFLDKHSLSDDDAKVILGEFLSRHLDLFSDWPHDRVKAQRVILGWLMCHRPVPPDGHWMKTQPKIRDAFWAVMGNNGLDETIVHQRVPRTSTFPGDLNELVDFVLYSTPEDRWQLGLPGMEGA